VYARAAVFDLPPPPVRLSSLAAGILGLFCVVGCDKDPPKTDAKDAGTTAPGTTASAPPPAPKKAEVFVEDGSATVSGDRVDFNAPDVKGRLAVALSGKPVEGQTIDVIATRDAKVPRMSAIVAALVAAKAKGMVVKTARRDKSTAEIALAIGAKHEGCAPVAHVAKDSVINVWPASGGTGVRFSRGLAGPDLTRGSEGIRKALAACDMPAWFLGADDTVTWGLLVDLVSAVAQPEDGGTPIGKPKDVALLVRQPAPGKAVDAD
jgi:hypothetical protein